MKKVWNSLFIIAVLAIASLLLSACGGNPIQEDFFFISSYPIGRLNLLPYAKIVDTDNIKFWVDSKEINPEDLPAGTWVFFEKIDPSQPGIFIIRTDRSAAGKKIGSTHVQLAKQGQGSSLCPGWAKDVIGDYCQIDASSVW